MSGALRLLPVKLEGSGGTWNGQAVMAGEHCIGYIEKMPDSDRIFRYHKMLTFSGQMSDAAILVELEDLRRGIIAELS